MCTNLLEYIYINSSGKAKAFKGTESRDEFEGLKNQIVLSRWALIVFKFLSLFFAWIQYNVNKKFLLAFLKALIKGSVRPDWICMRVVPLESPLKGHQPLYVFDFLISVINIWKNFKVLSHFMQNWTQPPACSDHGLHRILSSYWLAHCYLMKKIY